MTGFFEPQTGYLDGEHGFGGPGTPGFPKYGIIWVEAVFTHPVTGVKCGIGYSKGLMDDPWDDETYMFTEEMWAENFWTASVTIVKEGKWTP